VIVRAAQMPAIPGGNQDRVLVGERAVVVLDGVSGSDQVVSVVDYVDALGLRLIKLLDGEPERSLPDVVTVAIAGVVADLDVAVGRCPAATIAIVRDTGPAVETLVLCDSPIYVATGTGTHRVWDSRLADLPLVSREAALARVADGSGLDDTYRQLLAAMQAEKARWRNQVNGYWVAEADPSAGQHAIVRTFPTASVRWCALLTDGADEPMRHLGIGVDAVVHHDEQALVVLLARLHSWEAHDDPDARRLPRFKRHDDKTIAVVDFR
jgi:hypothetical protein